MFAVLNIVFLGALIAAIFGVVSWMTVLYTFIAFAVLSIIIGYVRAKLN